MALVLVVAQPFASYKRGDQITDPTVIQALLASPNAMRCRKVDQPDPPQPDH